MPKEPCYTNPSLHSFQAAQSTFGLVAVIEIGLDNHLILAVYDTPAAADNLHYGKSVTVEIVCIFILWQDVPFAKVVQKAVQLSNRVFGIP